MEKCPGFGLVFFGEANYSREVNISPGIPDKTIPRGGGGSLSGNPDVRRPFPRPEIPRAMSGQGRGRGIAGPRCTYDSQACWSDTNYNCPQAKWETRNIHGHQTEK